MSIVKTMVQYFILGGLYCAVLAGEDVKCKIALTDVNGGKNIVTIGTISHFAGSITNLKTSGHITICWQIEGDSFWSTSEPLDIEPAAKPSSSALYWKSDQVLAVDRFSENKKIRIVAVLHSEKNRFSSSRVYDYQSLLSRSIAVSGKCEAIIYPEKGKKDAVEVSAVRIDKLNGQKVEPNKLYEAGVENIVEGEAILPQGYYLKLFVEPINSISIWAMDTDPTFFGGYWSSKAYFGREGMDTWQKFLVYAIVSTVPFPSKQEYPKLEWLALKEKYVKAISAPIMVQRIEPIYRSGGSGGAGGSGGGADNRFVRLKIVQIDNLNVSPDTIVKVSAVSGIEGSLEGREPSKGENVWLFATHQKGEAWRLLGKAIFADKNYWQTTAKKLGEPGSKAIIQAVFTNGQPQAPDAITQGVLSRPVNVYLNKEGIRLTIESVGGESRKNGETIDTLSVPVMSDIIGMIEGRDKANNEKIAVYRQMIGKTEDWLMVGEGTQRDNINWNMPPQNIGKSGEIFWIMAIIGSDIPKRISQSNNEFIKAYSKPVVIKIR